MCSVESRTLQRTSWWTCWLIDGSQQQLLHGHKSNDFFLKDNKRVFALDLNVPKVTAYDCFRLIFEISHRFSLRFRKKVVYLQAKEIN